ncbi:hypothetical protein B0J13DRAFT_636767 [Dactylonectria estremocensis]|uniref:NmrA-like domain-containing protein n=1 Tax=Dactylonectria estremocensis TaxID=1079267 RepID=A0A9P9ESZ4_9HYPO|nr:hypothetical protein B0J13DRAFT_636767 [Dactylonectria estremocensis]
MKEDLRSRIKNVALAGATGIVGSYILAAFCQNKRYNLTLLVRDKSNIASFPPHITVIQVDYDSNESLVSALRGQDVLVSALGKAALHCQGRLVDAAVAANVRRIIPSEFGANLRNPKTRKFPTYALKISLENQLARSCELSNSSYTLIYTNCLLDWAISSRGALLVDQSKRLFKLYDGGNNKFSTTSLATVGHTVVAVLDHFEATANRVICVQDAAISQIELLELVKEVTAGDGGQEWDVLHIDTGDAETRALAALKQGALTSEVFYGFAVRAAFAPGYGGHFAHCDNELLGIKGIGRDEIKRLIRHVFSEDGQQALSH